MAHKETVEQGENALYFVQFMHPGKEHQPDDGCFKSWNHGKHKRKFLVSPGRCVRPLSNAPTAGEWQMKKGDLVFWGEWEPESEVVCRTAQHPPEYPRYIHQPYFVVPDSYSGLQNTDPFVFGGFFYGNCRQHRNGKSTCLCNLAPGSLILFGSSVAGKFVLDTVFVVDDDSISYDSTSYRSKLRRRVPRAYMDVVLEPLFQSGCSHREGCPPDKEEPYRLYKGVTYTDRHQFDAIFSFFPCMPHGERCEGFKRPRIKIPLPRFAKPPVAYRPECQADKSQLPELWQSVLDQVLEEGLWLGIETRMPERRRAKR